MKFLKTPLFKSTSGGSFCDFDDDMLKILEVLNSNDHKRVLTLPYRMMKNDQIYFNILAVFTPQDF